MTTIELKHFDAINEEIMFSYESEHIPNKKDEVSIEVKHEEFYYKVMHRDFVFKDKKLFKIIVIVEDL